MGSAKTLEELSVVGGVVNVDMNVAVVVVVVNIVGTNSKVVVDVSIVS